MIIYVAETRRSPWDTIPGEDGLGQYPCHNRGGNKSCVKLRQNCHECEHRDGGKSFMRSDVLTQSVSKEI